MNSMKNKLLPYLFILLGLLLLGYLEQHFPAGVCFVIGIVLILNRIWPETWYYSDKENQNTSNGMTL